MVKKFKVGENRIYAEKKNSKTRKYKNLGIFDYELKEKTRRAISKFQSLLKY